VLSVPAEFDRLRVVLVSSRNPLNIGAAARAMSNFGFLRLRVVNPFDAAFREARSAVGAAGVLADAEQYKSVAEAVADCKLVVGTTAVGVRDLNHSVKPLAIAARVIRKQLSTGKVAVLFGSEKFGLSNKDFSHCHWLTRIPTREDHRSMNLGQAVAVCMYELSRGTTVAGPREKEELAVSLEVERFTASLLGALKTSGYVNPAASTDEKVRRLVRRLKMPAKDVQVWLGVLRQIMWKMRSGK
jgi:TrmH family RNA methyltransferase